MDRKHRHTGSIGCFGGIHRGNEHGFETGITRGKRHGKRTADGPQLSGEGKLAEEERIATQLRCSRNPPNIRNPLIYFVNRYFLIFGVSQVQKPYRASTNGFLTF